MQVLHWFHWLCLVRHTALMAENCLPNVRFNAYWWQQPLQRSKDRFSGRTTNPVARLPILPDLQDRWTSSHGKTYLPHSVLLSKRNWYLSKRSKMLSCNPNILSALLKTTYGTWHRCWWFSNWLSSSAGTARRSGKTNSLLVSVVGCTQRQYDVTQKRVWSYLHFFSSPTLQSLFYACVDYRSKNFRRPCEKHQMANGLSRLLKIDTETFVLENEIPLLVVKACYRKTSDVLFNDANERATSKDATSRVVTATPRALECKHQPLEIQDLL